MRAETLPLVLPVLGAQGLPRGARIKVRLGEIDEITLDVNGTLVERLDSPEATAEAAAAGADEVAEDEDDAVAGPIAIAVDMNETDTTTPPAP